MNAHSKQLEITEEPPLLTFRGSGYTNSFRHVSFWRPLTEVIMDGDGPALICPTNDQPENLNVV